MNIIKLHRLRALPNPAPPYHPGPLAKASSTRPGSLSLSYYLQLPLDAQSSSGGAQSQHSRHLLPCHKSNNLDFVRQRFLWHLCNIHADMQIRLLSHLAVTYEIIHIDIGLETTHGRERDEKNNFAVPHGRAFKINLLLPKIANQSINQSINQLADTFLCS